MKRNEIKDFFELLRYCTKAKHIKRTGWVDHEIEEPETITGHMYCMALMSMLIPMEENVDRMKIMKMSLVHDFGESIVGDITPFMGVSEEDKFEREKKAMQELTALLPERVGKEMFDLWIEFEKCETKEAKYCKDLDKFDMIFQAFEYEKSSGKKLPTFYERNIFRNPLVQNLTSELMDERTKFLKERNTVDEKSKEK